MIKIAPILAVTLALTTPAAAQNLVPQPGKTEPAQPSPAAASLHGAASTSTAPTPLPGLVVQAPKLKACGYRDRACQAAVIHEIWTLYPEKVQAWCTAIQTKRAREKLNIEDMGFRGSTADFDTLPEPERAICLSQGKGPAAEKPFQGGQPTRPAPAAN